MYIITVLVEYDRTGVSTECAHLCIPTHNAAVEE